MRNIFMSLLAMAMTFQIQAQTHKEAKALLDEVKANTASFNNQKVAFSNTIVMPPRKEGESSKKRNMSGVIMIKGDQYRLLMNDLTYIYDGKKMYIVDPEIEEVDIMETEDENPLTPASILNEFDKNYSFKMGEKKSENGKNIQYIHLKPNGSTEIESVLVGIDLSKKLLYSYQMVGTNKVVTEILITKYEMNLSLPANTFTFNASEWSGYVIND